MRFVAALCALALAGCASSPALVDTGRVGIVTADALPPPSSVEVAQNQLRSYVVGPMDKLTVEVFGVESLSRSVQVDANGDIALPVAGSLKVAGLTPEQIAVQVQDRLAAGFVRNPQVSVGVAETLSQVVTVDGEVKSPGIFPVVGRMTLMRAVARAGGTTEFADTNHVVVFREVGDKQMAALYDMRAIRIGAYEDPDLYPDDVLLVGESRAARLFPQILTLGGLLLTPLVTILAR